MAIISVEVETIIGNCSTRPVTKLKMVCVPESISSGIFWIIALDRLVSIWPPISIILGAVELMLLTKSLNP